MPCADQRRQDSEKRMPTNSQLEKDSEDAIFAAYARSHDPALREQLIVRYIGLVSYLARRFYAHDEQLDDLIQVGFVGLIKAIDRFDISRGVSFTSYAVPTIVGEIRHYFRDLEQAIPLPRRLHDLRARAAEEMEQLSQQLGRAPSDQELASALDAPLEEVVAAQTDPLLSLDENRQADSFSLPLNAALDAADIEFERSEDRAIIAQILGRLSPRERIILYLRFYVGLSQQEVARRLGISQMHVSRLQHRSLEKIKRSIEL
jgi:RNA polymerase sigma-B factor